MSCQYTWPGSLKLKWAGYCQKKWTQSWDGRSLIEVYVVWLCFTAWTSLEVSCGEELEWRLEWRLEAELFSGTNRWNVAGCSTFVTCCSEMGTQGVLGVGIFATADTLATILECLDFCWPCKGLIILRIVTLLVLHVIFLLLVASIAVIACIGCRSVLAKPFVWNLAGYVVRSIVQARVVFCCFTSNGNPVNLFQVKVSLWNGQKFVHRCRIIDPWNYTENEVFISPHVFQLSCRCKFD